MHRTEIVGIRDCPLIPLAEDLDPRAKLNVNYDPMQANTMPPIRPNLLIHFFERPDHAGARPELYHRIPKKLRSKLEALSTVGSFSGLGLGVHRRSGLVSVLCARLRWVSGLLDHHCHLDSSQGGMCRECLAFGGLC